MLVSPEYLCHLVSGFNYDILKSFLFFAENNTVDNVRHNSRWHITKGMSMGDSCDLGTFHVQCVYLHTLIIQSNRSHSHDTAATLASILWLFHIILRKSFTVLLSRKRRQTGISRCSVAINFRHIRKP